MHSLNQIIIRYAYYFILTWVPFPAIISCMYASSDSLSRTDFINEVFISLCSFEWLMDDENEKDVIHCIAALYDYCHAHPVILNHIIDERIVYNVLTSSYSGSIFSFFLNNDDDVNDNMSTSIACILANEIIDYDNDGLIVDFTSNEEFGFDDYDDYISAIQALIRIDRIQDVHDGMNYLQDMLDACEHDDYSYVIALSRHSYEINNDESYVDAICMIHDYAGFLHIAGSSWGDTRHRFEPYYVDFASAISDVMADAAHAFNEHNESYNRDSHCIMRICDAFERIDDIQSWDYTQRAAAVHRFESFMDSIDNGDFIDRFTYNVFITGILNDMDALTVLMWTLDTMLSIQAFTGNGSEHSVDGGYDYRTSVDNQMFLHSLLYDCIIDGYPVEYAVEHTKMMVAGLDS